MSEGIDPVTEPRTISATGIGDRREPDSDGGAGARIGGASPLHDHHTVVTTTPVKEKKKKDKKSKLGSSRGVETMFRTTYRTHLDLSALADTKANIMISINGLIMSIIIASIAPKVDANDLLWMPTTVLLVSCLLSIVYAVRAARPRLTKREVTLEDIQSDRENLLFFGNFSSLSREDYVTGMVELVENNNRLYRNMMRDIYGLGVVLERKYALLRVSYMAFLGGIVLSTAAFIVYFVWASSSGVPTPVIYP